MRTTEISSGSPQYSMNVLVFINPNAKFRDTCSSGTRGFNPGLPGRLATMTSSTASRNLHMLSDVPAYKNAAHAAI